MNLLITVFIVLFVANSAHAQMTPEEQMMAVAIQGIEASHKASSEGMTMVRAALETLVHKKDVQIKDLQDQIAKLTEQVKCPSPTVPDTKADEK